MIGTNLELYKHFLNDKSIRFIYNDADIHYFLMTYCDLFRECSLIPKAYMSDDTKWHTQ